MNCQTFSNNVIYHILSISILLFILFSCEQKTELKPVLRKVEGQMVINDTINLEINQNEFLDMAKVRLSKSNIGLLNPLSVSFTLYDLNGTILNSFKTNKNVRKTGSGEEIIGGVPIDFIFSDEPAISMLEIATSKIVTYTLLGERIDSKDFKDDHSRGLSPMNLSLNTFLVNSKEFIFSTGGGLALNPDRIDINFDEKAGILFSLNTQNGNLNKEMYLSDIINSPVGDRLTFFQLGVFKNKRYVIFTNDPSIHVFDSRGKYQNSIALPIQQLEFVKEISLRQQASNLGISYFEVNESRFRLYIKKPIESSNKYETFIVDIAIDLSTYSVFKGPDNVQFVLNNPQSDFAFYSIDSENLILYLANIGNDIEDEN